MGVQIKTTSGPAIERPGDMVAILTKLEDNSILFIDEVHRLSRVVEEVLYGGMEDFRVSWVIDKGLKARSMNLTIRPFHADRRDDTVRDGQRAAAGPLRSDPQAGVLRRRRNAQHRRAVGQNTWRRVGGRRRGRDRQALARDAEGRQPASAPCTRLCAG